MIFFQFLMYLIEKKTATFHTNQYKYFQVNVQLKLSGWKSEVFSLTLLIIKLLSLLLYGKCLLLSKKNLLLFVQSKNKYKFFVQNLYESAS